ncbi:MAG: hypothetical protein ABIK51_04025 [candidate division WOR-3 bacterium]
MNLVVLTVHTSAQKNLFHLNLYHGEARAVWSHPEWESRFQDRVLLLLRFQDRLRAHKS